MTKRKVLIGSTALAAITAVGTGALIVASGGSSLVSNTVPTSKVVSSSSTSSSSSTPKPHPKFMFRRFGQGVYSETVVPQKSGGYKTIISVKGTLSAITSSSISVIRPDTGATVTATISSSTKFHSTTESALEADISSNKTVTVRLIESNGSAFAVMVPPAPGTRPKFPKGPLVGRPTPPSSTSTSSGSTA